MTVDQRLAQHLSRTPDTAQAAFVAADATLVGDIRLGRDASVFYGCVLRGDIHSIVIGEGTNVQDGSIIHLADEFGAVVGAWCTIGHGAMIHACTIGDECLIGMRATILDGAEIGSGSIVGACALVTKGTRVPPGSLVLGAPAKIVRPLTTEERTGLRRWAEKYVHVARAHASLQATRR